MPNPRGVYAGLIRSDVGVPTMHASRFRRLLDRALFWSESYSEQFERLTAIGMPSPSDGYGAPPLPIAPWNSGGLTTRLVLDGRGWPVDIEGKFIGANDDTYGHVYLPTHFWHALEQWQAAIDGGNVLGEPNATDIGVAQWHVTAMWLIGTWREKLELEGINFLEESA